MLTEGRDGVAIDRKRAFALVDDGTMIGCRDCKGVLANCYRLGFGCPKDLARSFELAKSSAGAGSKFGLWTLGKLYQLGEGGAEKNAEEALKCFNLSEAKNFSDAQNTLGLLYQSGDIVKENKLNALRMFELAAAQGLPVACMNAGNAYNHGLGVPPDKLQAIRWYKRGAAAGRSDAAEKLKGFERVMQVKGPGNLRVHLGCSTQSAHIGTLKQGCSFLFTEVTMLGPNVWAKLAPVHYGELQSAREFCNTPDFRPHMPEIFGYCLTFIGTLGGELFEEPKADVKAAVMARVQAAERKAEAQAANDVAAASKAAADGVPTVVYISGATGPLSEWINGGYDPTEKKTDGWPVYAKRGDAGMRIAHHDGKWQVQLVSDTGECRAFVDGNCPLEQCTSYIWKVQVKMGLDSWSPQPGVKMITGGDAERKVGFALSDKDALIFHIYLMKYHLIR